MAYKLLDAAQERWRALTGYELVAEVLAGVEFKDGERVVNEEDREQPQEEVAA